MKRLSTKFFVLVGLFLLFFSAFVLYRTYSMSRQASEDLLSRQADLALRFEMAVREYVGAEVRPVMYELVGEHEFIPETMSTSYVARQIFTEVQKHYPDFILKFSSDNPRNPANQAGPEELEIIRHFNENPEIERWKGEISIEGKRYIATFNARRMEESCLHCHGDPADAPPSLVKRYGSTAGFHRPLGEVVALDMVAIPTSILSRQLEAQFAQNSVVFGIGITALAVLVFFAAKLLITDRLRKISDHLGESAFGPDQHELKPVEGEGSDEIGLLARSFNTLAERLRDYYGSLNAQIMRTTEANARLENEIMEHRKTEEALAEAENRYRSIFENAIDGIFRASLDGEFLTLNPAFARMLHYGAPAMMLSANLGFREICVDQEEGEMLVRSLREETVSDFETRVRCQDGDARWVKVNGMKTDGAGGQQYLEGSLRDITLEKEEEERRLKLEEQLRQAQKMESIGRLVGGIAHDFNNILTPIVGYSDLVLERIGDGHEAAAQVRVIRESSVRAASLVRQLLAFGRKQILAPSPVDLNRIVKDLRTLLERTLGEDVRLLVKTGSESLMILADPGQVEQVIMNLAINARHAMPEGGTLTVETGSVLITEQHGEDGGELKPGPYARLVVADTGTGMTPEVQAQIFEPFFTTKEFGSGTGLGLATVYGIVKQHGGDVEVQSEAGRGSTFTVYLPFSREAPMPSVAALQTPRQREMQGTVMVVDDDAGVRELIGTVLRKHGYDLLEAGSGEEALRLAGEWQGRIDLLLTDVVMPGINGRELSERLRTCFEDMKVIFMSGYTRDVIARHGVLEEEASFLQKPCTPSQILNKLELVLGGGEAGRSESS